MSEKSAVVSPLWLAACVCLCLATKVHMDSSKNIIFGAHHKTGVFFVIQYAEKFCEMHNITSCTSTWDPILLAPRKRNTSILVQASAQFLPSWITKLGTNDRLIHLIRNPIDIIRSGYEYHFSGHENTKHSKSNFIFENNPLYCGSCLKNHDYWPLLRLQSYVQNITRFIHLQRHKKILRALSKVEGLHYEACWEFCNIYTMLKVKKLAEERQNVLNISLDFLMEHPEEATTKIQEFLGMDVPDVQRQLSSSTAKGLKHSSHSPLEKKQRLKSIIANLPLIVNVYEGIPDIL